jgi:mycothiol system anti-sigma-R factor
MKELDCNEVLDRLWVYLDGEADEAACRELEHHVAICLGCRHAVDFEVRLRRVIQTKCRGERAPQRLREGVHRLMGNSP